MNKFDSGQSLFEVVVALAITGLLIVSIVSLVSNSIRNATFSKNKSVAATYAQEATEWLRGQRDNNITTFETNALTSMWCLRTLSWDLAGGCLDSYQIPGTPFTREVTFTVSTVNGKTLIQADVIVFWEDSQGIHQIDNSTDFTDWRER